MPRPIINDKLFNNNYIPFSKSLFACLGRDRTVFCPYNRKIIIRTSINTKAVPIFNDWYRFFDTVPALEMISRCRSSSPTAR